VTRIYLDHNATTPVASACVDAMAAALREEYGNPSSVHHFGQKAKAVIDEARSRVADLISADPSEVVFTSGGTESDNSAIRGAAEAQELAGRRHLVASTIEHEAVLNTVKALGRRGFEVSWLPVGDTGVMDPEALRPLIGDRTAVVSVMHANNEVGTIQPVAELARLAKSCGALVHVDAVQSAGKIPLDVKALGADLVSMSAHTFYGPKGIGALWIRRGVRLVATSTGGRHERGRRAGTENVAGIVGMGVAARLARSHQAEEAARLAALRDRLEEGVLRSVSGTVVNGQRNLRVPNTSNISFDRVEAESLLIGLDLAGIAVSTGSACSSGTLEPSHVLKAMGFAPHRTQNSIRFSLGAANTEADVDRTIAVLPGIVEKLRNLTRSPVRA
jgi:cysteine desulfurase